MRAKELYAVWQEFMYFIFFYFTYVFRNENVSTDRIFTNICISFWNVFEGAFLGLSGVFKAFLLAVLLDYFNLDDSFLRK